MYTLLFELHNGELCLVASDQSGEAAQFGEGVFKSAKSLGDSSLPLIY